MSFTDHVDPSNKYRIATLEHGSPSPIHYDLVIQADLESLTFNGTVEILLDVPKETNRLTFHVGKDLKVYEEAVGLATLDGEGKVVGEVLRGARIKKAEGEDERVTVFFGSEGQEVVIKPGKVKLGLAYSSPLGKAMMGFYRSEYKPVGSQESKFYALTQFEPTAARQAFPSWDEPNFKATFSISILADSAYTALANMPAKSTKKDVPLVFPPSTLFDATSLKSLNEKVLESENAKSSKKWTLTKFEESPKVSTYLVTYAVGPFEYREREVKLAGGRTIPLRHYGTSDTIKQVKKCLDVSVELLPHYEEIFDLPFPLPKLDTLTAHDFDAGAMEGWGLITGRLEMQLFDEEMPSLDIDRRVTSTQSHEISHMWFGDIVTMHWWDNLWLNEAFATLIGEYVVLDRIRPEWKVWDDFVTSALKSALQLDGTRSSHPIEVECQDSNRVNQIFDSISYEKGASVLRMLMRLVGEEKFLKGVSIYLKRFVYSNSKTKDLWDAISEASGINVAEMMSSWTLKIGFPVVRVEEVEGGLKVTQNRFLRSGRPSPEEDETIWKIPLFLKTMDKDGKITVDSSVMLDSREKIISLPNVKDTTYKLNADMNGVYRVLYPAERSATIAKEAAKGDGFTSVADRVGLVQDAFALAVAGFGETSTVLELVTNLTNEQSFLVWEEIGVLLSHTQSAWLEKDPKIFDALKTVRANLFRPLVKKLGFAYDDKEPRATHELRTLAIGQSVLADDEYAVNEVIKIFNKAQEAGDRSILPADYRRVTFGAVVRRGGQKEWETIYQIFKNPSSPSERGDALQALCFTHDDALIDRVMNMILDPAETKDNELVRFSGPLGALPLTRRRFWKWFTSGDNYDKVATRYNGNFSFGHFIYGTFSQFSTLEDYDVIQKFFASKDTGGYFQRLNEGLEGVKIRAAWVTKDSQDVERWLTRNGYLKQ